MNEQPGHPGRPGELVRPVVDRKTATPPRKQPFDARRMPMGVSANTMGVAGHLRKQKIRRQLFFGIPAVLLAMVVIGVWLAARNLSPLTPKVISNDIFEYHFNFYKTAEPVNLDQGEGLQDANRVLVIAKPTTDRVFGDCSEVGTGWHRAFIATVEGRQQQVCSRDNKVYLMVFSYEQKRHLFEITYSSSQNGKIEEIRSIIQSLRVSVP